MSGTPVVGTQGGGLIRLKNGKFTRYTVTDGLFVKVVPREWRDTGRFLARSI